MCKFHMIKLEFPIMQSWLMIVCTFCLSSAYTSKCTQYCCLKSTVLGILVLAYQSWDSHANKKMMMVARTRTTN